MDLESLKDLADEAHEELGKYAVRFFLSPEKLAADDFVLDQLGWSSIGFDNDDELENVPDDKRGVYAFVVTHQNDVLPQHGYVLYIGMAGQKSDRPLRERYQDYLNPAKVKKRMGITRMIANWYDVLHFYFAPVDDEVSTEELEELEKQLNTAMMSPFAEKDMDADAKRKRKAFP